MCHHVGGSIINTTVSFKKHVARYLSHIHLCCDAVDRVVLKDGKYVQRCLSRTKVSEAAYESL